MSLDGEGVAGNSNSSFDKEMSKAPLINIKDVGENYVLRLDGDATLIGSSGDAGGSDKCFESQSPGNTGGDLGENSKLNPDDKLNPDGEGVAENSNSSTHCTDGDASLPGSSGDAGGSDKNSKSCCSGNVESAGENSKLSPNGEGVPGSSNLSTDEEMSEELVWNTGVVGNNSNLRSNGDATLPLSSGDV